MAENETNSSGRQHPRCLKTPGETCRLRPIVPVRFALTSEKEPPLVHSGISGKDELPKLANHRFTLRKIWDGYIFITWDGLEDENILVYQRTRGGKYLEVSRHGYGEYPQYVTIPVSVTEAYMTYVRIPDLGDEISHARDSKFNLPEPLALIAENLLKDDKKRMQRIILGAAPYSAPRDEIFTLVEEFRKPDENARLRYLDTWPDSREYLNPKILFGQPPSLNAIFREMWAASVDTPDDREHESVRDMNYPMDSVLVALHDGVGHVYDCAKVYDASLTGMVNFEKMHSVMLLSGYLSQNALKSYAGSLHAAVDEKRKKYIEIYKLGESLATGEYNKVERTPLESVMLFNCHEAILEEQNRDRAGAWVRRHENYVPEGDQNYLKLEAYQDLDGMKNHRKMCEKAMKIFTRESKIILSDWVTLLCDEKDKKFSFHWVLREIFWADDQETSISTDWKVGGPEPANAKSLTHIRDAVFIIGHHQIAKFLPAAEPSHKNGTCDYFEYLFTKLVQPGNFIHLLEIMGKGGIPLENFSSLLGDLTPFIAYCNGSKKKDMQTFSLAAQKVFTTRFGLKDPERTHDGGSVFLDALLLDDMILRIDADKFSNPVKYTDNDAAWFANIFTEQFLVKLHPDAKALVQEINELKAELSQTSKNAKVRKLEERIQKVRQRLKECHVFILDSKETAHAITDMDGKPWNSLERKRAADILAPSSYQSEGLGTPPYMKRLQSFTVHFMTVLSVFNTAMYSFEIMDNLRDKKYEDAVKNAIYLMPHALGSAESAFAVFGRRALRGCTYRAALGAGVFADTVMTIDLVMKRDYDAALGCGIMASTGLGLTIVTLTASGGLASMCTPATAVLFLLFLGGLVIFLACKDDDLEAYLKNGVWSTKMVEQRKAVLSGTHITCLGSLEDEKKILPSLRQGIRQALAMWEEQRADVQDFMRKAYPVVPLLCNTEKLLYLGLNMPASSSKKLMLKITLVRGMKRLELTSKHTLKEHESAVSGLHTFEVYFNLDEIKAMLDEQPGDIEFLGDHGIIHVAPYQVLVSFKYSYNEYIDYREQVLIHNLSMPTAKTPANEVAMASLKDLAQSLDM